MTQETPQEPLKVKFRITWNEHFTLNNSFGDETDSWFAGQSTIIYAGSEEEACKIWEKEFANEGTQSGIEDCIAVFEHPLLDQYIETSMPDGAIYQTPVEYIAKHRAKHYADQFEGDEIQSLIEDTLPYFAEHHSKIAVWATQNISWIEIKAHSRKISPEPDLDAMNDAWKTSWEESKLLELQFTPKTLKYLSAPSIIKIICDELQEDDQWQASAAELVRAVIPRQVKMRGIGWDNITPDSIARNAGLFELDHAISEKGETYSIHESEYLQLVAPIKLFLEKTYSIKPDELKRLSEDKVQEQHQQILLELKHACMRAFEKSSN